MMWFMRKTADAADANTVTVKDYAVRVAGLPPDASGRALREYLTRAAAEGAGEEEEPGEVREGWGVAVGRQTKAVGPRTLFSFMGRARGTREAGNGSLLC